MRVHTDVLVWALGVLCIYMRSRLVVLVERVIGQFFSGTKQQHDGWATVSLQKYPCSSICMGVAVDQAGEHTCK